jgi:glycosyltransferase involved in cell wall biosynthesis
MYQKAVNVYQSIQFFIFRFFVQRNLIRADFVQSLGGKLNDIIRSIGISERKVLTCPIGIPSEWIRSEPLTRNKQKESFVFIGRFEPRKGLGILLQAFARFVDSIPDATLTVIGEVPLHFRRDLKGVTYLGNVVERETIREVLDNSNFLILPSMSEGLPTVVLEAMARGCVVLAPRIGALGEVLTDTNSITIEQVDPAGLEATLQKTIRLTEDEIFRMRGTAVNNVSNGFTWNDIAEKMIGQFNRILQPASRISDRI